MVGRHHAAHTWEPVSEVSPERKSSGCSANRSHTHISHTDQVLGCFLIPIMGLAELEKPCQLHSIFEYTDS